MSEITDVVIVGGGAIGTSCAFHLAASGVDTVVLEHDQVAAGSSSCATGMINGINGDFDDPGFLRWGLLGYGATRRVVPILEDLAGMNLYYQDRPCLRLALDDEEEKQVREELDWQVAETDVRWLDGDEVRAIEPRLSSDVRGAALEAESCQVPGTLLTRGFMRSAERLGSVLVPARATGLEREAGRVVGVRHRHGVVFASTVVLAMGASASAASSWLDYDVPVRPLWGERLMLRYPQPPLQVLLTTPRRGHLISRLDGFLSVGSTGGRDLDDVPDWTGASEATAIGSNTHRPTDEARDELLQRATEVLPSVAFASVGEQIAGVRPASPDSRPIIGRVPGESNVYLATGHTHRGIQLAAITGEIVRDLIVHGSVRSRADPGLFAPERFVR